MRPRPFPGIGAIILLRRSLLPGGVDLTAIESRPLVLVAKDGIGGRNRLEALFRRCIAGVQIRVQFLRELAVRRLDFLARRGRFHAENFIWIVSSHHPTHPSVNVTADAPAVSYVPPG